MMPPLIFSEASRTSGSPTALIVNGGANLIEFTIIVGPTHLTSLVATILQVVNREQLQHLPQTTRLLLLRYPHHELNTNLDPSPGCFWNIAII